MSLSLAQPTSPFSSLDEVRVEAVTVVGHAVRTSHDSIANHAPASWAKATTDPRLVGPAGPAVLGPPFFGVYCDYESDFQGAYTLFVGVEAADEDASNDDELTRLQLPAGLYAKIVVDDPNPLKIVAAWRYVWMELASRDRRTYLFDYEVHTQETATLFIGLRE